MHGLNSCCGSERPYSKVVSTLKELISDVMRKIGDDKFDVAKQEELMLKFLGAIGKFKNLMVLAEKLLEFKKQITLKGLEEDKKEDEEEKTEEADKKDSIEVSLDAIESLEE